MDFKIPEVFIPVCNLSDELRLLIMIIIQQKTFMGIKFILIHESEGLRLINGDFCWTCKWCLSSKCHHVQPDWYDNICIYIYIRPAGLGINIPHHHCCPKYTYHIPGNVHFSFYSFNIDKYLGRVSTHVRNSKFVNL